LSRHIGLNSQGARIVEALFRKTPTHSAAPIILGLLVALAGTVAVAGSLHVLYERLFGLEHRGWHDLPRFLVWVAVLFGVLIAEGSYDGPVRRGAGVVVRDLVSFVLFTGFFAWTLNTMESATRPDAAGPWGWRSRRPRTEPARTRASVLQRQAPSTEF
jgi:hypothetical protein